MTEDTGSMLVPGHIIQRRFIEFCFSEKQMTFHRTPFHQTAYSHFIEFLIASIFRCGIPHQKLKDANIKKHVE